MVNHIKESVLEYLKKLKENSPGERVTSTKIGRELNKHPWRIKMILYELQNEIEGLELIRRNKFEYWRLK